LFSKKDKLAAEVVVAALSSREPICYRQSFDAPSPLCGQLFLRKELRGIPRTASGMPDERNANTDAERGQIHYDHDKGKQIHPHSQSNCGMQRSRIREIKKIYQR
jgi:hypothetical protein